MYELYATSQKPNSCIDTYCTFVILKIEINYRRYSLAYLKILTVPSANNFFSRHNIDEHTITANTARSELSTEACAGTARLRCSAYQHHRLNRQYLRYLHNRQYQHSQLHFLPSHRCAVPSPNPTLNIRKICPRERTSNRGNTRSMRTGIIIILVSFSVLYFKLIAILARIYSII